MLELLAATGLRASEVAELAVGDLELNERSGWVTVRGKGRKQRRVPMHAKARRALREHLRVCSAPASDAPLFTKFPLDAPQLAGGRKAGSPVGEFPVAKGKKPWYS